MKRAVAGVLAALTVGAGVVTAAPAAQARVDGEVSTRFARVGVEPLFAWDEEDLDGTFYARLQYLDEDSAQWLPLARRVIWLDVSPDGGHSYTHLVAKRTNASGVVRIRFDLSCSLKWRAVFTGNLRYDSVRRASPIYEC